MAMTPQQTCRIEDLEPNEWVEKVYKPDVGKADTLYKTAGYNPLRQKRTRATAISRVGIPSFPGECEPATRCHTLTIAFIPRK